MACKCDVGLSNTGTACTPLQAVARQYILTPKFKADGTLNKLDITSTLNTAFWTSQVNATAEERWYPLPRVQNVTDEKGDNIVQSFNDGSTAFIAEGARTVVGFLPGQAPGPLRRSVPTCGGGLQWGAPQYRSLAALEAGYSP